jgi:selenoprotein W-related protein
MAEHILEEFEHRIGDLTIIPSRGGVFEVMADETLVYSKKATGRHAEVDDVMVPLRKLIG